MAELTPESPEWRQASLISVREGLLVEKRMCAFGRMVFPRDKQEALDDVERQLVEVAIEIEQQKNDSLHEWLNG